MNVSDVWTHVIGKDDVYVLFRAYFFFKNIEDIKIVIKLTGL